jgi:hypothetical protein
MLFLLSQSRSDFGLIQSELELADFCLEVLDSVEGGPCYEKLNKELT